MREIALVVPVAETLCSHCRGPGLIPDQGSRSSMPQITVHVPILKIPHAAAKIQHSLKKKRKISARVLGSMVLLPLRKQPSQHQILQRVLEPDVLASHTSLSLTSCVALSKLLNLSVPHFPAAKWN